MNPFDVPQNQKEKECHNLDESQSSSVSIKIFNNNEDNVVIRLYRNNKKGSRDRSRNSFGHPSRRSGRSFAGKDKNKPTMLRNLYRNTFGPTLDETVLVGMETFQMCQHGAHPNSLANTSDEGFQKNGRSIIPNELSWDCSTLLPTNANGKQFESVCTSTSNCALDRERNLSPLLTNQYQFDPFSNKSDTALSDEMQGMMTAEAIRSFAEATRVEDNLCHLNNISSDENLNITRSTITDPKHDNKKTLASISTYFGTKDPSFVVSELDSQQLPDNDPSESGTLDENGNDNIQVTESTASSSSCPENCSICQEFKKKPLVSDERQTDPDELFASNLLPKCNFNKNRQLPKINTNYPKSAAAIYSYQTSFSHSYSLKKSKSHPVQNPVNPITSSFSSSTSKNKSTDITSTAKASNNLEPSRSTPKKKAIEVSAPILPDQPKIEFPEVPYWERKKSYPTARFIQGKIKKPFLKKYSRLPAGSDRPSRMLYSSCSASSWMTNHSLKSSIKKLPNGKAREICKGLQELGNRPVLKVKHVLSTSSSSIISSTSTLSSSYWCSERQRSGTDSSNNVYHDVLMMHEKLASLENQVTAERRATAAAAAAADAAGGKPRLNNSDIMLPPTETNESILQDGSINTRTSTIGPSIQHYKRNSIPQKYSPGSLEDPTTRRVTNLQKAEVIYRANSLEPKNERRSVSPVHFRPKEEYCKSTGVVYTTDPSSAGIFPDSQEVHKVWDYTDRERPKRKPILEKLVDVISDYSKRSPVIRSPVCCDCNRNPVREEHKRRVHRRTPILQKIFEVFSKKNPSNTFANFDERYSCKAPKTHSDSRRTSFKEYPLIANMDDWEEKPRRYSKRPSLMLDNFTETETYKYREFQERGKNYQDPSGKFEKYTETEKSGGDELEEPRRNSLSPRDEKQNLKPDKYLISKVETEHYNPDDVEVKQKRCNNETCLARKQYEERKKQQSDNFEETPNKVAEQLTEKKEHDSGEIQEKRIPCNRQTCPAKIRQSEERQRKAEKRRCSTNESMDTKEDPKNQNSILLEIEGGRTSQDVPRKRKQCSCSKAIVRQSFSKEEISEGGSCDCSIDPSDPKSLSRSASFPVISLRSNEVSITQPRKTPSCEVFRNKSKRASVSDQKDKIVYRVYLGETQRKDSKPSSQVKIDDKKSPRVVTYNMAKNSEGGDISSKNRSKHKTKQSKKASSKKHKDKSCVDEGNNGKIDADKLKEAEINARLSSLLQKGLQMKISELSPKIRKPLMWRSFMGNKHINDTASQPPERKSKKQQETNNKEQTKNMLQKKCLISSKSESDTEVNEGKQNITVCAFRDCSNFKPFQSRRKGDAVTTDSRASGGSEYKETPQTNDQNLVLSNKPSSCSSEAGPSENGECTLQPNFRRRSSGNSNSGRELSDLAATDGAPQKRRTAIHKSVRKSSGYDAPSSRFSFSEAPRYSTRHSTRQPSTSMGRSFVEDPNYALPIDEKGGMCKCCPDISKILQENMRRLGSGPSLTTDGAIERRTTEFQSIAQPSRKCTFHDTLTQNYYRDPSFNSEPYEEDLSGRSFPEDLEGNTRRSTVQRRSTSPGSREPSRKMSTKIADFFRKNSKKSTSPYLSFPDKTVEGYVRTASNEDMPRLSVFSKETYNDDPRKSRLSSVPRRSTVAQKTVTEDEDPTDEDIWRRFIQVTETRESKVGPEKCRRSTSPKRSSFLRKSLKEDTPDDDPIKEEDFRKSTIGAEDRESKGFVSNLRKSSFPAKSESNEEIPQQEEHQKCRRTITPRKSSAARKTFLEDDDPAEEKSTTEGRESKGFVNTPRKCTASPCSSIPAKSIEIEGPLEEDVDNDILPAQQQEYRRSSTPRSSRPSSARKSYHEGEEEIPRRSFLPEGRESKASPDIIRNPAFSSSTPRNSFEEDLPSTFDEPLRVSTFSPEPPGKEEVHLPGNSGKSRQISTQQPDEVHVCEKPRLGVCRCEKDTSRNKVPQETRYAITRVTKYDDYTTYEILKSTRAKPKKIPEVLEKIFIEKEQ